jgi:hypothetical protein
MVMATLRSILAGALLAAFLPSGSALAFADGPRWPEFGYGDGAAIASGCLRWNWQQYSWYDHCPVYVRPKAYMYPASSLRSVVRVKG